jgi:hypothetical protein
LRYFACRFFSDLDGVDRNQALWRHCRHKYLPAVVLASRAGCNCALRIILAWNLLLRKILAKSLIHGRLDAFRTTIDASCLIEVALRPYE